MADGLELKRIVDLVAQTDIDEGVYTIIDSVSGAVKKYPLGSFICSVAPIFDATAAYAAGAYCNYNGQLYQFDEAHAAGAWTGEDATAVTLSQILGENGEDISDLQGDVSSLQIDMAGKADANGNYPNMTAGNADQLVSSVKIEDQVPYIFRTSGGSVDIGDRETDMIVGGSLVWNQLSIIAGISWGANYNGITITKVDNATIKVSGTATANANARAFYTGVNFPPNHVYLLDGFDNRMQVRIGNGSDVVGGGLCKPSASTESTVIFYITNGTDFGDGVELKPQIFDLTQMFGSTIADYIYSLGTALSGAGVAWFRKLFPKDYYAYNAGEIMSVSGVSAHQMTGFNQWDEEWEVGGYDTTTGEKKTASNQIRSKNAVAVIPNTTYYLLVPYSSLIAGFFALLYYDASGAYLSSGTGPSDGYAFTTPSNAHYVRFFVSTLYGTTYKGDICINLHWDGERDGEYEPYELHSYALDDSLTLRGIPKLDANNALYYDGDTYESDGTVTRRYGVVDLGTLDWAYAEETNDFYSTSDIANFKQATAWYQELNMLCSRYITQSANSNVDEGNISINTLNSPRVRIQDSSYENAAAFKIAMSGVYLVYELATPTTESADAYQNPQIVNDWGTEEYVTESIVPVGHDTLYQPNLRAKLEMAPNSPDGDGDYIVRQTDGINEYVELVIPSELPAAPTTDGNYKLRVSVSGGTATYSWVSDS